VAAALMAGSLTLLAEEPLAIFNQNCSPCHGKDGKARTPIARKLGVKDLSQSNISDAEIERQIRDGRKTPDGKQAMPAFGDKISAADMKPLIAFVKKFRR
jgi:mono/diheme cytochrome c family protein